MIIELENNTIKYLQFLKLFAIGWTLGLGSISIVMGFISLLFSMLSGNWPEAINILTMIVLVPIVLLLQSPIFGSLVYLGIAVFRNFKVLKFTNVV